jgi:hypothetical protein
MCTAYRGLHCRWERKVLPRLQRRERRWKRRKSKVRNSMHFIFFGLAIYLGIISFTTYWRVRTIRSFLYMGITCFLIILLYAFGYLLKVEWPILNQSLFVALLLSFAVWVARAVTVESGIYSGLRKKARWYTLLIGKVPAFLLEHEKIEPTTSRMKGIAWGCFLIVFPLIAWPFLNSPLSGVLMLGSVGVVTVIYSLVYLR